MQPAGFSLPLSLFPSFILLAGSSAKGRRRSSSASLAPPDVVRDASPTDDWTTTLDVEARHKIELIGEADNVADSEDSEDEWNFYRPEEEQEKKAAAAAESSSSKPDRCEEEREACSPCVESQPDAAVAAAALAESEDNDNRPQSSGTDDVTAEFDEIHETETAEKDVPAATLLLEHQLDHSDIEVETEAEAIAAVAAVAAAATAPLPLDGEEQLTLNQELLDDEDMESHLNPDAKEFVPSSPGSPPPAVPQLAQMNSDLVAGSPLKQNQRALKNRTIPSEEEFQEEICRRPSEIGDESADFSNSEASPNTSAINATNLLGGFDDDRQKTVLMNLDDSEVSSTKAEFGDESSYSVASEFYRTGVDCSYTGSERGEFDAMATSMTPSDFKQAFEQEPDLNKVHELKDEDLLCATEVQNGVHEEAAPKIHVDIDDLVNNAANFDLHQQNVSVEAFSAVVEERVSSYDNDDLLMNMRNTEQSKEELPSSTFNNPFTNVDTIQHLTAGMQNVNLEMEADEKPLGEPVMMNPLDLTFGGPPAEQKADEEILVSPVKEPEIMSSKFEEDNLISRSTEALARDEFKTETEEAFDKPSHVEDLSPMNKQLAEAMKADAVEEFVHKMQVEERDAKPFNLSESLQEFTGLEEQLSPQSHQVKDNICFYEAPTLKESLVDEPKDVEEVAMPPAFEETKNVPLLSNEIPEKVAAPVAEIAATVAAAAAATTAVAAAAAAAAAAPTAKPEKPSSATKTSKPTATSKVAAKASPTSPAKTGVAAKTSATAAKKPLAAAARPKLNSTAAPKPATGLASKPAAAAKTTTAAAKAATATAAKPAPRTTLAPAAPKPKLSNVTSKIGSLSADKKPTANGDVKSAAAKPTPSARTLTKPPTSTSAPKTSLVKTSTNTRMSIGATTTAPKTRPASSTTAKTTTTSRLSTTGVTSSTSAARPKTAPATTTSTAAAKSKLGTKSPMIDKQIKETANKQISSARTSISAAAPKPRTTTTTSTTTANKRVSLAPKPAPSPTKKPTSSVAATKTAPKTSVQSKVNSKVSSTTKTSTAVKTEVVQNGVCESEESKISTTTTTTTTNIEEDIPMKDVSPIEQVTDNQLITAE